MGTLQRMAAAAMTPDEKLRRLRVLLAQLAADHGGDLAALAPARGAMPGFESLGGDPEDARAAASLDRLARTPGADFSTDEIAGFEAIVLPRARPVAFVRGGAYANFDAPWEGLNAAAVRERLRPLLASIGRIELPGHPIAPYGGTGFVVGRGLVMTNRHVAELFCHGLGRRGLAFRRGGARIHFGREHGAPARDEDMLLVEDVAMIHPYWDMALLRVAGLSAERAPLVLSVHPPEELSGSDVVVVGYPARDPRNDAADQDRIFARTFHVKRAQPGKVRGTATIESFGSNVRAMVHDASTLGGNSGSAVIEVATGEVVGLHFGGAYLVANYAVPAYELARDPRVVAAGLAFAGAVPPGTDADAAWRRAEPTGGERPA